MAQQDSGTTGIGNDDIDADGRTDAAPSQAETGGSGGAGLTRHEGDGAAAGAPKNDKPAHPPTESGALGAGDTRTRQAEGDKLGSAESGANQTPDDLAPAARTSGA